MSADTVAEWVEDHGARLAPVSLSAAFDGFLRTLPWAGAGID
ncbi:hypothetical protein [Streptomyces sp. SBT349]|nr:hypothetical protein [Streptomyces sp. SBT349]